MRGPAIIAQSIQNAAIAGKYGNSWQYHSRSDRHSKIACVAIMFDLLENCPTLRSDAETDRIYFGINHEMSDFRTGRKKDLDLVVATRGTATTKRRRSLLQLAQKYELSLGPEDAEAISALPTVWEGSIGAVRPACDRSVQGNPAVTRSTDGSDFNVRISAWTGTPGN
jgi:hypothetical protein